MAMERTDKIHAILIMLGAEEVSKISWGQNGKKREMISYASDNWLKKGLSKEFNLIKPADGQKDLTDGALNAMLYLYSKNFEATSAYEKENVKFVKNYVKNAVVGKCDVNSLYDGLFAIQNKFASDSELERQRIVGTNTYDLFPKRTGGKGMVPFVAKTLSVMGERDRLRNLENN